MAKEKKPKEPMTRVTMIFPEALKEELQELAGSRGVTKWVIDACQERLAGAEPDGSRVIGPKSELNEARKLAQRLADMLAESIEVEAALVPADFLSVPFPAWVQQDTWPDFLRSPQVEKPEPKLAVIDPEPAPVATVATVLDPEPEPTPNLAEVKATATDLLARVQAKAAELGIADAGLVPASSLPVPEKPVDEAVPEPVKLDEIARCETCGGVLVDGTCWTCAF